jgi:uncharacterized membrane protein
MMNGFDGMMGGMGGSELFFVVFWIVLLAVVVLAVARVLLPRLDVTLQSGAGNDPAVEALRLRFGRGEIDTEEYLRALEVLNSGPTAPSKELPVR